MGVSDALSTGMQANIPSASDVSDALSTGLNMFAQPSERFILLNEAIWCTVSLGMSIVSSVMLVLCLYLKVATFTGDVANLAIITVALHYVSDLDDKIMEGSPEIKLKYR